MNIPSLKIKFEDEEKSFILREIEECLTTGQLSQGTKVLRFEEELASFVKVKHAVAVNSGSSAIEVMMRTLGVEGKEVLVPTNTFLATAMGVLLAGGVVRLVDTDPKTFSVSLEELKKRVTKKTTGVIIVHIGGIITPEIDKIAAWCKQEGIWLFEDAAHALGSTLNGKHAGSFGIAGEYSLFATKVITSGEGGSIVTNSEELTEKMRLYRNHGKPKPWETYHTQVGANYRMSEITSIMAYSQLKRLGNILQEREAIAKRYTDMLKSNSELTLINPMCNSNWYKYIILLPKGIERDLLKQKMKEKGVNLQGEVYGVPLHRQPIAVQLGFEGDFSNADDVCSRHICLPIYQDLTVEQQDYIVTVLQDTLENIKNGGH
ncbi:aminotransferase DegT [Anaerocolumna cellulosilytica]|uniref:Aminotransferase DegT n=1 Tax=Anaerocolumna cellulosilytica TaxID=433286 RepID=A0A6S6R781_9FIRM|nr:DegT/DnrJ/EryC1/StrS family aminotransferase [Anaerocolumna cellulosilytica]MBB5193928.1 dTDP-4-amino-4,6-dideoxygalactose transaminase [Anaerocolumna cellulosilytica]BCJ94858.1 aminotransferase DegT [Anaerocolumna cellulosilytica]